MGLNIPPEQIKAMSDLVASGDLSLTERREAFAKLAGRPTTLTDAQLLEAVALTDDDDDDLFMQNVIKVEAEY